jgi:hypothetical protein
MQSDRWSRVIDGGTGVYDETLCAYCARPVRSDATRLYTARTNDGEWWLVSVDEDLSTDEWRDFQTQADGARAPTCLPIGPDCLRDHPEFAFAVVKYWSLDDLPVMGSGKGHLYTREVAERCRGRRGNVGAVDPSETICTWPIDGRIPSKQALPCNRADCPHCRPGRTS